MEHFEANRFEEVTNRTLSHQYEAHSNGLRLPPIMELVGGLAFAAAIWYGSSRIARGELTTGEFTSFMAALFMMYGPVKKLSRVNATFQQALAASSRVFSVLDTHLEIVEVPDAIKLHRLRIKSNFAT